MKVCIICNRKIKERKEKWVRLTDFDGKKQIGETYYHLICWKDRFKKTQERIQQETQKMLKPAFGMLGKVMKMIKQNEDDSGMVVEV